LKLKPLAYASLMLLLPLLVKADTITLVPGTPGNTNLSPPTGPSPNLGGLLIDFPLTQFPYNASGTTFNPSTYASEGVTISSPDGLLVDPLFEQGPTPNELFDEGAGGTADITISLATGSSYIGVGLSDFDDPVDVTLQALGAGGVDLGPAFNVSTEVLDAESSSVNPGQTYFVVEDNNPNIRGLVITQTDSNPNNSGLAIADIQAAPEPSSLVFMVGGIMAIIGCSRLRKKA
jgi:hypothetical protein